MRAQLLICLFAINLISQELKSQGDAPPEIFFANLSDTPSGDVYFKIYPISFVFNGGSQYDLEA